jgi:hypothetical protein
MKVVSVVIFEVGYRHLQPSGCRALLLEVQITDSPSPR